VSQQNAGFFPLTCKKKMVAFIYQPTRAEFEATTERRTEPRFLLAALPPQNAINACQHVAKSPASRS
jgi:hypothetical protein